MGLHRKGHGTTNYTLGHIFEAAQSMEYSISIDTTMRHWQFVEVNFSFRLALMQQELSGCQEYANMIAIDDKLISTYECSHYLHVLPVGDILV